MKMKKLTLVICILVVSLILGCQTKLNDQGQAKGIVVHGDWTIDIRNADGTLSDTTTFTNEVTEDGILSLIALVGEGGPPGSGVDYEYASHDGYYMHFEMAGTGGYVKMYCENGQSLYGRNNEDFDGNVPATVVKNIPPKTVSSKESVWTSTCIVPAPPDGVLYIYLNGVKTRFNFLTDLPEFDGFYSPIFTQKVFEGDDIKLVTEGQKIEATVRISFTNGP